MKTVGKWLAGVLALSSALAGGLLFFRIRSRSGTALWTPKVTASALTPFTAVAGLAGAILGGLLSAPLAVAAGLFGWIASTRYVQKVTAPHNQFDWAFGPNWQRTIAPDAWNRMLARRWTWRMPDSGAARLEQDIPFWTVPGTGRELLADVWQPPEGVRPSGLGFVYLHGSGWFVLDKDTGTRPLFRHLASQGHVVMDVAYRMVPETGWHGMVADAKRAVVWLKENADRYGVDPQKVVIGGGSAGAHLALMAAYTPGHPLLTAEDLKQCDTAVRGAAVYYAPIDLRAQVEHGERVFHDPREQSPEPSILQKALKKGIGKAISQLSRRVQPDSYEWYRRNGSKLAGLNQEKVFLMLTGGTPVETPQTYDLFSPLTHAGAGSPPTLLFQGEHDYYVPSRSTRALAEKLENCGVPVIAIQYPQTEHAFDMILPEFSPVAQSSLYDLDRFLAIMAGDWQPPEGRSV